MRRRKIALARRENSKNALNSRARNEAARGFKGDRDDPERPRNVRGGRGTSSQLNPGVLSTRFLSRYAVTAARVPDVCTWGRGGARLCKLFSDRSREFNSASRASSVPKRMVISAGLFSSFLCRSNVFETSFFFFCFRVG